MEVPKKCCKAYNAECLSCVAGQTVGEYCKENPQIGGCEEQPRACCLAMTASCLACAAGVPIDVYCEANPEMVGCEQKLLSNFLFDYTIAALIFVFVLIGLTAYVVRKYVLKN